MLVLSTVPLLISTLAVVLHKITNYQQYDDGQQNKSKSLSFKLVLMPFQLSPKLRRIFVHYAREKKAWESLGSH